MNPSRHERTDRLKKPSPRRGEGKGEGVARSRPASQRARDRARRRHGIAWLALTAALAFHVADEAAHDFLSLYNPNAAAIRRALPFLPLPTFTLTSWLVSLAVAVAVLAALSTAAFRGVRWAVPASNVYAGLMVVNGLFHTLGSLALGRPLPGVISSPLLLVAGIWLVVAARGAHRSPV